MTNSNNVPWIEKYRPSKLEHMIQSDNLLNFFQNIIEKNSISHYLFHGPPGTGKTSAILAIGRELFKEHFRTRVIEFNASDDRGINAVREKITKVARKSVSSIKSADGTTIPGFKIIILDEADSLTEEAQDALRVIIEQYSKVTRFCFICNYLCRMTDAIKSRCTPIFFRKLSEDCVRSKLAYIAESEGLEIQKNIIDTLIEISNGDMRKAITHLQNLKYLNQYNLMMNKPYYEMDYEELGKLSIIHLDGTQSYEIDQNDIYRIAATISPDTARDIIDRVFKCRSIVEISELTRDTISYGYPVDTVITQICNLVLDHDVLSDEQKAKIIHYSGPILLRMKECSNEFIQLIDFMSCIYGIIKGLDAYNPRI